MTEQIRRRIGAPRRHTWDWIEGLAIAGLIGVVLILRASGTLPPDATSPVGPWILDVLGTSLGPLVR